MGFKSNSDKIKAILLTVPEVKHVYAYHKADFPGFPTATFEAGGLANTFISSSDNERGYGFQLVIHQSLEKPFGREKGVEALYIAVDAVLAALDGDYDFGGTTDINDPATVQFGEYVNTAGAIKYAIFTLNLRKEETV
jgi:hypothetical protein